MKKPSGFKMRSGNKPSFAKLSGANRSPMRQENKGGGKQDYSTMSDEEMAKISKKALQDAADRARKENPGDEGIEKIILLYQARDPTVRAIAQVIRRRARERANKRNTGTTPDVSTEPTA